MKLLEPILRTTIEKNGPMPFAQFMDTCLFHPEHGYYNTNDPLQDFATAPEISQMFGEMIALWCIDSWMKLGSPAAFTLLECGPGRGTLMDDVMRTAKIAPDFLAAAQPTMLERSPLLKAKQQAKLYGQNVTWITDIAECPAQPVIMFCNEFFDAFAVQPYIKTKNGWAQRSVEFVNNDFVFGMQGAKAEEQNLFNAYADAADGTIIEINHAANAWLESFAQILKSYSGTALLIDYGYDGPAPANTVQAIYNKKMSPVLKHLGEADITAHVDFAPFRDIAQAAQLNVSALHNMRDFLLACGIMQRAQILKTKGDANIIDTGLNRLIAPEQMGTLFKVMCVHNKTLAPPIGGE